MTKISELNDTVRGLLSTTLTGYAEIPDPYDIPNNSKLYLRQGYATGYGPAEQVRRQGCPFFTERRNMQIFLIRENIASSTDPDDRTSIEKTLMEDAYLVKKAIELDNTLGGDVTDMTFVADTGLQYIVPVNDQDAPTNRDKFYAIELTFEVEYQENISP